VNILVGSFEERIRKSISFAWTIFSEKVGSGSLGINKEASMQLQYSIILQSILPLVCFNGYEGVKIELETGEVVEGRSREIDLVVIGTTHHPNIKPTIYKIAVEMKCYREVTSSGGKRGATDIFMKDVYEDMQLLENYCDLVGYDSGVALVMNDLDRLVNPKTKTAKCWDYDISNGAQVSNVHLKTPIGGRPVNFLIRKSYRFDWIKKGEFWFLENEGL